MITRRALLGSTIFVPAILVACSGLTPAQVALDADALYNAAIEAVNKLVSSNVTIPAKVNEDLALAKAVADAIGSNVTTFDLNGYITAAEDIIGLLGPLAAGIPGLEPVGLALSAISVLLPVIVAVFGGTVAPATTLVARFRLPPMDLATARARYRPKK